MIMGPLGLQKVQISFALHDLVLDMDSMDHQVSWCLFLGQNVFGITTVVVSTAKKAINIAKSLKQKVNPTREGSKALAS